MPNNAEEKPVFLQNKMTNNLRNLDEFIEPGDNTKYIAMALQTWDAPEIDLSDETQVRERIEWYFKRCMSNDMKPGVVGLANALGVSRKTLWAWNNGVRGVTKPGTVDTVKKAYGFLEEMWENYMLNGKISPPNGIFLGKNWFDYKDVQDVVVTPNNPYPQGDVGNVAKLVDALPESTTDPE